MRTYRQAFVRVITLLFLLLVPFAETAQAHGEDRVLQLQDVEAGPYRLTAWTAPGVLRTGEIHVETVVLTDDQVPTLDVLVQVIVTPLAATSRPTVAIARPPQQSGVIQEAAFRLMQPGSYRVDVRIQGANGEQGVAGFAMEVVAVSWLTKALIYLQWIIALLAGAWLIFVAKSTWVGERSNRPPHTPVTGPIG